MVETDETVEIMEGVLVMTVLGLGDSDGVTTVMDDGTCNEGERTVGGRDRGDAESGADTFAVSVREGDKEDGLGDSDGVTTIMDDGTCNEGEQIVGGRD